MKFIYFIRFMVSKVYFFGLFILLDDWLKWDWFVFIGWLGLLFFIVYLVVGGWFIYYFL